MPLAKTRKRESIQSKGVVENVPDSPTVTTGSFLRKLLQNVENWAEVYFWVPVAFMSIYFMSLAAFWLSGRAPRMSLDWMPELGANLFKCVCAIVLTSIVKEALWGWLNVQDKIASPVLALTRMGFEVVALMAFLYVLFNR
jgi:hypothetical protein